MKSILAMLTTCLVGCSSAPMPSARDQSPPPDLPVSHTGLQGLTSPRVYAFGGIGYAGTTSEGELALRRVLQWKDPVTELMRRFDEANPQGQAYILAALRELSPDEFKIKRQRFLSKHGNIMVMYGCSGFEGSRSAVIRSIEKDRPVKSLLLGKYKR